MSAAALERIAAALERIAASLEAPPEQQYEVASAQPPQSIMVETPNGMVEVKPSKFA